MSPSAHRLDSRINWNTDSQRKYWNAWDTQYLNTISDETQRRGNEVLSIVSSLGLQRPRILEIGCGNGWLAQQLLSFGPVTGVDIADAAIEDARRTVPSAEFLEGDILQLHLPRSSFDLAVTLETLSHVSDQARFFEVISNLLSDSGHLILTTQNRSVYLRNSRIASPGPGQLRRWVTLRELRELLSPNFECMRSYTIEPRGDRGILRIVNSAKVTAILSFLISKQRAIRLKERLGFGQTLVVLARKRR